MDVEVEELTLIIQTLYSPLTSHSNQQILIGVRNLDDCFWILNGLLVGSRKYRA
jgi:hypothetical protein